MIDIIQILLLSVIFTILGINIRIHSRKRILHFVINHTIAIIIGLISSYLIYEKMLKKNLI